jgi:hypothetical protein
MCLAGCDRPKTPTNNVTPVASAIQSCPTSLPSNCTEAPSEIRLPKDVNDSMQKAYKNSFPGGKSQENGGTLVKDDKGNIKVVNEGVGTTGTFSPNRTTGSGQTVIGTYHTHPYDASEGGHTGVSFSGADIAYANHYKEPIYVDAGTKQFMIMPTQETPAADSATLNTEWNKEYADLLKTGKSVPDASAEATNKIAKKYKMAYYEGKDGTLKRVSC